jgi:dTDP-glucose 4,6-dehydratase
MLARSYAVSHGLPLLVTRGSNNYGPYQYPEKIVPLHITNAIDGLQLPLYNDGSAVRDYLFVEDHCRAIDLVLHQGAVGEAYNVGTGRETSGNEVARTILDVLGKDQALIQYVADRPGHDYRYALDIGKLAGLGWSPAVGFREGMERTVTWYQEHESWWRPLKSGDYWKYYRRNYRPLELDLSR